VVDGRPANEVWLAYIQSPVGRRFLESGPIPVEAGTRPIGAPIGRILWSAQAGMVVAFGGLGLLYASTRMAAGAPGVSELSLPLFVMGIVALGLGLGFVVSAVMAYGISRRLGLFEAPVIAPHASSDPDRRPTPRRLHSVGRGRLRHGRGHVPRVLRADGPAGVDLPVAYHGRSAGGRRPPAGNLLPVPARRAGVRERGAPAELSVPHRDEPG